MRRSEEGGRGGSTKTHIWLSSSYQEEEKKKEKTSTNDETYWTYW